MPRGDIRQLLVKAIFSLLEIWNGGSRIRVSFQKLVVQTELSSGRFSFGRDERGELAFLCYCASGPSLDSSQCTISDFFFPIGVLATSLSTTTWDQKVARLSQHESQAL